MKNTPPVFTPIHIEEAKALSCANEESLKKLIRNINFLMDLVPVGKVMIFNPNQRGATIPSGSIFQYCNGDSITHPDSPIRTIGVAERHVPNAQGRVLRMAPNLSTNPMGGNQTYDFKHNHGGNTMGGGAGPFVFQAGGNRRYLPDHSHSISDDLNERTINYPRCFLAGAYMKIV